MDIDEEVRQANTFDHQNKVYGGKNVVSCTLVDESGVAARIDFWGDQADDVHQQLQHEVALAPVGI